ncbi:MAG: alkaline phosphatase family protein [Gemmataceae bacterium]|nr:alkaline phosphatase family protein [Gemmataceae bacterium]
MADDRRAAKVLLIGWDAADWKFINPLLDAGRMPNLSRLVDEGVIGNIATLRPCLSPILWTSIATGKTADKHGIAGFVEPIPDGSGVRLSSSTSRTTKAIWNILSQSQITSAVVNWYASHPAEPIRGTCISNRFFEGPPADPNRPWEVVPGSVHPESLLPIVAQFRMHPAELGRADIARFIPDIDRIDLTTDRRPAQLAAALARTVSVHSVATGIMEAEPWDFLAVYYDGLDVAGHQFMPYHPPQMPGVSDGDFATYQHVMRELYLFHDAMLGRLLDLAGPDTTVILVSDHGFHCDHLRPTQSAETEEAQAALWHRQYGIFAMRGPGVRQDERVYGANLLDITPTVLTLFGLPVGLDMDGRPLLQAFENPPGHLATIPSWDGVPGEAGTHPSELLQPAAKSQAAIEQLIALGYLPAASAEARQAVVIAVAESKFNLAVVHSSHGRERKAVSLLEGLHEEFPDQPRYALALAKSHANLGQHPQSRAIIEKLEARGWQSPETDLLAAAALFHEGKADLALARLADCERKYPPAAAIYTMIGNMCAARKNWHESAEAFEKSLALDGDDPLAHNGLAQALLRLCRYEPAAEHALRAVGLLFFFPQAHFNLGMAFLGMGEPDRAARSLELAVSQSPGFHEARHQLEMLNRSRE